MVQCMRLAKEQLAERRERYFRLVLNGMSSSEACRRVGVSKRTGKVWRNGRRRSSGRNELPLLPYVVMENSNTLKCEGRNNYVRRAGERYLSLEDRLEGGFNPPPQHNHVKLYLSQYYHTARLSHSVSVQDVQLALASLTSCAVDH